MSDHKLPNYAPENDIRHIKRYWIYLTGSADSRNWLTDLKFYIVGHTSADEDGSGGTPIGSIVQADAKIKEFLEADGPETSHFVERTQLDFAIEKKCFIALKLFGDFWEFSPRSDGAVRTKDDLDRRYYRLLRYRFNNRAACIAFCAQQPEEEWKGERHGINLYVDFLEPRGRDRLRLPVQIDPDIENKGGHGYLDPPP
jgi:hypothetical protein